MHRADAARMAAARCRRAGPLSRTTPPASAHRTRRDPNPEEDKQRRIDLAIQDRRHRHAVSTHPEDELAGRVRAARSDHAYTGRRRRRCPGAAADRRGRGSAVAGISGGSCHGRHRGATTGTPPAVARPHLAFPAPTFAAVQGGAWARAGPGHRHSRGLRGGTNRSVTFANLGATLDSGGHALFTSGSAPTARDPPHRGAMSGAEAVASGCSPRAGATVLHAHARARRAAGGATQASVASEGARGADPGPADRAVGVDGRRTPRQMRWRHRRLPRRLQGVPGSRKPEFTGKG
ncbi:hypothetical protein QJS66_16490 [Kocuria rhizophila]|nr:hypothetical protein QJS66_16490 [Kocuria rhizophila]